MTELLLPGEHGAIESFLVNCPPVPAPTGGRLATRGVIAAAHVVADPYVASSGGSCVLDWEATMAYRRYLWSFGLGVAEAMDTAQRGTGLDWETARELVARSASAAAEVGGVLLAGVGTDQLPPGRPVTLDDVTAAYREQLGVVSALAAQPVIMPSRHLAASADTPDDYLGVYRQVLASADRPVVLHWLGEVFDPALAGYWGTANLDEATAVVLQLVGEHADVIDGVKLSLLDPAREVQFRRHLPDTVRLYTGDDYHFVELLLGDAEGHSHALLGVFDPLAPLAAAAVRALDEGDIDRYRAVLDPTVPLARHLFAPPVPHYKTGVVFLAWLNGHQDHFKMVGGLESARSVLHLTQLFRLATQAGILSDPALAVERMGHLLAMAGVRQPEVARS